MIWLQLYLAAGVFEAGRSWEFGTHEHGPRWVKVAACVIQVATWPIWLVAGKRGQ